MCIYIFTMYTYKKFVFRFILSNHIVNHACDWIIRHHWPTTHQCSRQRLSPCIPDGICDVFLLDIKHFLRICRVQYMHISILYPLMSDVQLCHAIKQTSSVTSWPWLDHQYIYIYRTSKHMSMSGNITWTRDLWKECTFFGEYEWCLSFRYTSREWLQWPIRKKKKQYKKYIHQPLKFNLNRPSYELQNPPWKFWWFQVVDFYNHQSLLESTIFTSANYIEILAFVAGPGSAREWRAGEVLMLDLLRSLQCIGGRENNILWKFI